MPTITFDLSALALPMGMFVIHLLMTHAPTYFGIGMNYVLSTTTYGHMCAHATSSCSMLIYVGIRGTGVTFLGARRIDHGLMRSPIICCILVLAHSETHG